MYLGLIEEDIIKLTNDFMIKNYLTEKNNQNPCMKVSLNLEKSTALLELTTVEESHRLIQCKTIKVLG